MTILCEGWQFGVKYHIFMTNKDQLTGNIVGKENNSEYSRND